MSALTTGQRVAIVQNTAGTIADDHIIHHISDDGRTVWVRDNPLATAITVTVYTRRGNGRYVVKGRKAETWNATYLLAI